MGTQQNRPAAQEGGPRVDRHHQVEAPGRRFEDALPVEGAGVVHQDVYPAEALQRARRHRLDFEDQGSPILGRWNLQPVCEAYKAGKKNSKLPTSSTLCLSQARPFASVNTCDRIQRLSTNRAGTAFVPTCILD